MFAMLIFNSYH